MNWRAESRCSQVGGDLFFPRDGEGPNRWPGRDKAIAICAECPVRQACLDSAMTFEKGQSEAYRNGIYGGLLPAERAQLATQPKKAVVGSKHNPDVVAKVRGLYDEGRPFRDIAAITGLGYGQVTYIIQTHGMANRRAKRTTGAELEQRIALVANLKADGLTSNEIATRLDITDQ